MNKILISTSSFNTATPEIQALEAAGYEIIMNPYGRRLTESEVSDLLTSDIVGLIAGVEPLTKDVIFNAKGLKVISRCGAGLDSVDIQAAKQKNIEVFVTPDAPTDSVAELSVGLMIDCLRKISLQDRLIREGVWARPMGGLLGACTVGLIGFGRIGRRVAECLSGFNAHVLAHDPLPKTQDEPAEFVDLATLLARADIVSLHIPYTPDNHHLLNATRIALMKPGAILINVARGGLVDEDALVKALDSGHLAAAALDVYEEEPYNGPLVDQDNIILTAHIGSYAKETRKKQEAEATTNLFKGLVDSKKHLARG